MKGEDVEERGRAMHKMKAERELGRGIYKEGTVDREEVRGESTKGNFL